jgi:cell division protein FtsQ
VANYEAQFSRVAALADHGDEDDLLRPRVTARPQAQRSLREDRPRNDSRRNDMPRSRASAQAYAADVQPLTLDTAPSNDAAEDDDEEIVRRARRRAPVKRSIVPKGRAGRIVLALCALTALIGLTASILAVRSFFEHDPRFRIDGASSIQILGNSQVTRAELLAVFGGDIGRNIFFVPLAERRAELENLPWVKHATVMRLLPNQLRIAVVERAPIAFVRNGNRVGLVDEDGVLLDMPPAMMAARRYSFPVVAGIGPHTELELRVQRMQLYQRFVSALDADGSRSAEQLSEVDLSDPEDVRAVLPAAGSDILVHFGDENFAERYRSFQQHLPGWKRQYPNLASVDLRYQHQTVLEMAPDKPEAGAALTTPASHTPLAHHPSQHKIVKKHSTTPAKAARPRTARG